MRIKGREKRRKKGEKEKVEKINMKK